MLHLTIEASPSEGIERGVSGTREGVEDDGFGFLGVKSSSRMRRGASLSSVLFFFFVLEGKGEMSSSSEGISTANGSPIAERRGKKTQRGLQNPTQLRQEMPRLLKYSLSLSLCGTGHRAYRPGHVNPIEPRPHWARYWICIAGP